MLDWILEKIAYLCYDFPNKSLGLFNMKKIIVMSLLFSSAILSFSLNADKRPETAFCAAFYLNLGRHSLAADLRHLLRYKRNFEKIMRLAEFGDSHGANLQGMESPVFHRRRSVDTAIPYCR